MSNISFSEFETELSVISSSLCNALHNFSDSFSQQRPEVFLPSRREILNLIELARTVLFPGFFGNDGVSVKSMPLHVASCLDELQMKLCEQIKRGFCFGRKQHNLNCGDCEQKACNISKKFVSLLPFIQEMLLLDAGAAYDGDPAATSVDECIYSYPGLLAVTNYRIAHELYKLNVPIIPRIITEQAHSITGIDIHPGAQIGKSFFIDHGTGVVIGETCIIGDRVRIYQGVTLGAKSFQFDEDGRAVKGNLRHPILEDDVIVYSGSTILGRITIGKNSVIGGNTWLTHDVPPGSVITFAQKKNSEDKK